jgi:hypothetical protein
MSDKQHSDSMPPSDEALREKLIDLLLSDENFSINSLLLDELISLFHSYASEQERAGRVDELNHLAILSLTYQRDERIEKRVAELQANEELDK